MQSTPPTRMIRTPQGASIADHVTGEGPPLVLVHGSAADHSDWALVQPLLEDRFEVHAMDRRGRGASTDGDVWALEREVEDIVAVLDALTEPACLAAHSFGALVALEAALHSDRVTRLVLYEPPLFLTEDKPLAFADHLDTILATGDLDRVAETFLRELGGIPDEELAAMKADANVWKPIRESAPTLSREIRGASTYAFEPKRLAELRVPVLILTGSESEPFYRDAVTALHAAVPGSRVETIPGQSHGALLEDPQRVAHALAGFCAP